MSYKNNNTNSINNSLSISQSKKSDEELSKDIFIHILRINNSYNQKNNSQYLK